METELPEAVFVTDSLADKNLHVLVVELVLRLATHAVVGRLAKALLSIQLLHVVVKLEVGNLVAQFSELHALTGSTEVRSQFIDLSFEVIQLNVKKFTLARMLSRTSRID